MRTWAYLLIPCLFLAGCGDDGGTAGSDAEVPVREDGGATEADAGPSADCDTGEHACPDGCREDQANAPDVGCRLGCGDPCPSVEGGTAACTNDGRCGFECVPPSVPDGGECRCEPRSCEDLGAMCGEPDDGCGGALSCGTCDDGAPCVSGQCTCAPDAAETNEEFTAASSLGRFNDRRDDEETFMTYSLESAADIDWFVVTVEDGTDLGPPDVRVELTGIPEGADYHLGAWLVCDENDGRNNDSTCDAGAPDATLGAGCVSDATGSLSELVAIDVDCSGGVLGSDEGLLFVRVAATADTASCDPYVLSIQVE